MNYIKLLIPFFLITCITSCDIINPEEDIPAFIEILPFEYTPELGGSSSTKITDGWVYVNGEFLGAFNLPNTVPVLAEGDVEIIIDAGIKENGIVETPNIYPFYLRYTESVTLIAGEEITIQPTTTYDDEVVNMLLEEDFNDPTLNFTDEIEITEIDTREGNSGLFLLDSEDNISLTSFSDPITVFPGAGNIAFLELDYKGDVNVFVGIVGYDGFGQQNFSELSYGATARDDWNKIYFNYTELMRLLKERDAVSYQIVVAAQIPIEGGAPAMEEAEVRVDNVKFIIF